MKNIRKFVIFMLALVFLDVIYAINFNGTSLKNEYLNSASENFGEKYQVKEDLFKDVSNTDYILYASWQASRLSGGYIYIYTLYDNTNISIYYCTSFSGCQMTNLLTSWANVPAQSPLSYGNLTGSYYFFKIVSNYPITCELSTPSYDGYKENNRFVISSNLNYTGTTFYFHANYETYEKTYIINPGTNFVSTIDVYYWRNSTWQLYTSFSNLAPDAYLTFGVPESNFYKVVATSPILIWEGRLYNQNIGIGVSPEGTTISNVIYCPIHLDIFSSGNSGKLFVTGITDASYTIYYRSESSNWAVYTTGTVSQNNTIVYTGLQEERLYKIVTSSSEQKIQVQFLTGTNYDGGAEMIPARDNNQSTNPGTSFIFRFGEDYQKSIACLIPQSGTTVNINGPTNGSFTSSVDDTGYRLNISSNQGTYTITASNPIYVVAETDSGTEAGYFIYRTESWLTPTPTVSPTPTLTPTPPPVPSMNLISFFFVIVLISIFFIFRKKQ